MKMQYYVLSWIFKRSMTSDVSSSSLTVFHNCSPAYNKVLSREVCRPDVSQDKNELIKSSESRYQVGRISTS